MKKTNVLLSIATGVGMTIGLMGCGGDGINDPLPTQTQAVPARMVATYSLATSSIPIPNDLLFAGSELPDLTLNIPVADPEDYADPKVAINGLDGWSAVAPFSISFSSSDANVGLDGNSVAGGSNVHVYKVNVIRPEVAPGVIAPTGPVASIERELVHGAEYIATAASATSIAIVPIVPFESQASYMVVLTNGLQDTAGLPILNDSQFGIVKSPVPISTEEPAPGATDVRGLIPVQGLVNAMVNATTAFDGAPSSAEIILAYQFTVQSVGTVMQTAKAVYIDGAIAGGAIPATGFASLGVDTSPFTGLPTSAANLYAGQITLNYMLGTQTEDNPLGPLNTFWRTAAFVPNPADPFGPFVPNPAPLGNLSYANPLPQINTQETVPLLVSIPKGGEFGCDKPAAGYPVVIFQHGITANRTNLIGIADSLAAAPSCTAAVAMDMPLHGIAADNPTGLFVGYTPGGLRERTMGIDFLDNATGASGQDGIPDTSGAHTINLANLQVARDNNRQAIFDLLYLEKAVAFMDIDGAEVGEGESPYDFDASRVSYIGHSLGGIVGTGVIGYSDNIKAAGLANPGGGIALMLNGSDSFGPRIRAGVAGAAGIDVENAAFPAVLSQFLFAAQTVLDSADPVNTAVFANANQVPTLLLQVLDDSVVPNSVAGAPLAGTEPLGRVLGLTTTAVSDETGVVVGSRLFTKLNRGLHSSLLTPSDGIEGGNPVEFLDVTTEMQTEIVSFLASGGAVVQVVDPTLLQE